MVCPAEISQPMQWTSSFGGVHFLGQKKNMKNAILQKSPYFNHKPTKGWDSRKADSGGVWILSHISRTKQYLAKPFELGLLLYMFPRRLRDFVHILSQNFFRAAESSKARDPWMWRQTIQNFNQVLQSYTKNLV